MELVLHDSDLRALIEAAVEGKVKVRAVTCGADEVKVRVAYGILPALVEFREFALEHDKVSLRVAGSVAPKLLSLFRSKLEQHSVEVDGDRLRIPIPDEVRQALRVRELQVESTGLRLRGELADLSGFVKSGSR